MMRDTARTFSYFGDPFQWIGAPCRDATCVRCFSETASSRPTEEAKRSSSGCKLHLTCEFSNAIADYGRAVLIRDVHDQFIRRIVEIAEKGSLDLHTLLFWRSMKKWGPHPKLESRSK